MSSGDAPIDKKNIQFYVNELAWEDQSKRNPDLSESDEYGFINIPDKWEWWMIMYQNVIYVLDSRRMVTQRVMASLNMDQISKETWFDKDARVHPPIEPMEEMEAGYCMMVKIKIPPKDGKDLWLVCMSSSKLAGAWASAFSLASADALQM